MKQTTNYLMHLPEVSDYADIGVLNENTVKIDGELWKKADKKHSHPAGDITGLDAAIAGKADKRVPAAAGNLAALDGTGNLMDSGKKPGDFGGSILQLTFDAAFAGRPYTVTAPGESYGGMVPAGLKAEVSVKNCRTTYTVEATIESGEKYSTTVTTGDYFGQCQARLTAFSATLRVTTKAGAAVTAVSGGNTYPATADGSGIATLSIKQPGTYAVTATQGGDTVSGSVAITTSGSTYNLTLTFISPTLENNSWAKIREVSDAGNGENYWKIGDKKAVTIHGKVGETQFSNLTVYAFILGFNHNAAREGSNRIHFQIGKTADGVDIALVDSKYADIMSTTGYFSINALNNNAGGYVGSQMWSNILGNWGTPTSPTANTLLAALPAALRAAMKQVTKYSDNTGGGADTASYVTATTESLFLLSEFEYHGIRSYANSAEQTFQQQYPYYKAGNSKIKYRHDNSTVSVLFWTRSVDEFGGAYFCAMAANGRVEHSPTSANLALAPGFCV